MLSAHPHCWGCVSSPSLLPRPLSPVCPASCPAVPSPPGDLPPTAASPAPRSVSPSRRNVGCLLGSLSSAPPPSPPSSHGQAHRGLSTTHQRLLSPRLISSASLPQPTFFLPSAGLHTLPRQSASQPNTSEEPCQSLPPALPHSPPAPVISGSFYPLPFSPHRMPSGSEIAQRALGAATTPAFLLPLPLNSPASSCYLPPVHPPRTLTAEACGILQEEDEEDEVQDSSGAPEKHSPLFSGGERSRLDRLVPKEEEEEEEKGRRPASLLRASRPREQKVPLPLAHRQLQEETRHYEALPSRHLLTTGASHQVAASHQQKGLDLAPSTLSVDRRAANSRSSSAATGLLGQSSSFSSSACHRVSPLRLQKQRHGACASLGLDQGGEGGQGGQRSFTCEKTGDATDGAEEESRHVGERGRERRHHEMSKPVSLGASSSSQEERTRTDGGMPTVFCRSRGTPSSVASSSLNEASRDTSTHLIPSSRSTTPPRLLPRLPEMPRVRLICSAYKKSGGEGHTTAPPLGGNISLKNLPGSSSFVADWREEERDDGRKGEGGREEQMSERSVDRDPPEERQGQPVEERGGYTGEGEEEDWARSSRQLLQREGMTGRSATGQLSERDGRKSENRDGETMPGGRDRMSEKEVEEERPWWYFGGVRDQADEDSVKRGGAGTTSMQDTRVIPRRCTPSGVHTPEDVTSRTIVIPRRTTPKPLSQHHQSESAPIATSIAGSSQQDLTEKVNFLPPPGVPGTEAGVVSPERSVEGFCVDGNSPGERGQEDREKREELSSPKRRCLELGKEEGREEERRKRIVETPKKRRGSTEGRERENREEGGVKVRRPTSPPASTHRIQRASSSARGGAAAGQHRSLFRRLAGSQ